MILNSHLSDFKVGKIYTSQWFKSNPIILILKINLINYYNKSANVKYLNLHSLEACEHFLIRENWTEVL